MPPCSAPGICPDDVGIAPLVAPPDEHAAKSVAVRDKPIIEKIRIVANLLGVEEKEGAALRLLPKLGCASPFVILSEARIFSAPSVVFSVHHRTVKQENNEMSERPSNAPPIVTPHAWEAARQELLVKEKAMTRARDALAAERRRMPWVAVEKDYFFEGPEGRVSLKDLFEGRRQLIVYRAFFEPGVFGWPDHACRGCSLGADQVAHLAHLNARDTTLAYASRAPQADIARLKARMGWEMPWYTMTDDFDKDFGVDEWHGTNVFFRDGDRVYRTYFINNRGDEAMGSTWSYLDVTPLGRQEDWEDSPAGYPQTPPYQWWNWHDSYSAAPVDPTWKKVSEAALETLRAGNRR
jgi:predicted dithiol-disulfide oxidoreductase (DUF899 family)